MIVCKQHAAGAKIKCPVNNVPDPQKHRPNCADSHVFTSEEQLVSIEENGMHPLFHRVVQLCPQVLVQILVSRIDLASHQLLVCSELHQSARGADDLHGIAVSIQRVCQRLRRSFDHPPDGSEPVEQATGDCRRIGTDQRAEVRRQGLPAIPRLRRRSWAHRPIAKASICK